MPGPDDDEKRDAEAEQKPARKRGTGLSRLLFDAPESGSEDKVKRAAETRRIPVSAQPEATSGPNDEEKPSAEAEQKAAAKRGTGLGRLLLEGFQPGSESEEKPAAEMQRTSAPEQPQEAEAPEEVASEEVASEEKVSEEVVSDVAAAATISPEEREATEPPEPVEAQTAAKGEETALLAAQEDQARIEKLTAEARERCETIAEMVASDQYQQALSQLDSIGEEYAETEHHAKFESLRSDAIRGIEEAKRRADEEAGKQRLGGRQVRFKTVEEYLADEEAEELTLRDPTAEAKEHYAAISAQIEAGRHEQALSQLDSIGEEYAETEYHAKFESLRSDAIRGIEEAKRRADEEAEKQRLGELTTEAKEHYAAISAQIEAGQHEQALRELNFLGGRYAATEYHAELETLKRVAIDRAEEQKRLAAERAEQEKELLELDELAQGAEEAVVSPSVEDAPSSAYSEPALPPAPPRPQGLKVSAGRPRGSPTQRLATAPRGGADLAPPGPTPGEGAIPVGGLVSTTSSFVRALLRRPPMELIIGGAVAAVIILGIPVFAVVILGSGSSQASAPAPFSTPEPYRSKPAAAPARRSATARGGTRARVEGLKASKETTDAVVVPAAGPAETSGLPGSAEEETRSAEPIGEAEGAAHSRASREETSDARVVPEDEPAERKATGLVERARDELGPEKEITNSIGMQFVLVPAGEFTAGSEKGDADERPVHEAFLDAYYIGRHEVTNAQFQHFDATHRDKWKEYSPGDDMPVVCVTWEGATSFCKWLSRKEGVEYRLPTEAEWEKAARGTDARIYPWGNEAPDAGGAYRCNTGGRDREVWKLDGHEFVSPVGSFPKGASPSGCFDMAGNVWEWCLDWYATDYSSTAERNPPGPTTGARRVMRGGSFTNGFAVLRCSNRRAAAPSFYEGNVGFRCVRAGKEHKTP